MHVIEFKNISKSYRMGSNVLHALRDVSFSIEQHELLAVIGPSGSGKSTMMHIMGLLDTPTSGQYYLENNLVSQFNRKQQAYYRNQKIGFIFQKFFLLPRMTALDNVSLPLFYRNVPKEERHELAIDMLDRVGMKSHALHKPSELSGGQQQRVAIARALLGKPSLILADEPTGALDRKTSDSVVELLKQLATESTVVIITHDTNIASQCSRQLLIIDGVIHEE